MTLDDIANAVMQLTPSELARFRTWLDAYEAEKFDAEIERDVASGKLDALADEALAAHRAGQTRDI